MKATEIAAGEAQKIDHAVQYLQRMLFDQESRRERAVDAVSYLCAEVQRFLDDPDGVGYDALANARQTVLSMHSGNFSPLLRNPLSMAMTEWSKEQVDAAKSILLRIERPRRYAGDWEADTARRILNALNDAGFDIVKRAP